VAFEHREIRYHARPPAALDHRPQDGSPSRRHEQWNWTGCRGFGIQCHRGTVEQEVKRRASAGEVRARFAKPRQVLCPVDDGNRAAMHGHPHRRPDPALRYDPEHPRGNVLHRGIEPAATVGILAGRELIGAMEEPAAQDRPAAVQIEPTDQVVGVVLEIFEALEILREIARRHGPDAQPSGMHAFDCSVTSTRQPSMPKPPMAA
jgi:hypothetical protein